MLKITRVDEGASDSIPTLKLEGKLLGPWVDELRRACEELHTPPSGLRLNLAGVTFIDPAGIKLHGDLIRRGAAISECTGFVDEQLKAQSVGKVIRGGPAAPGPCHAVPCPPLTRAVPARNPSPRWGSSGRGHSALSIRQDLLQETIDMFLASCHCPRRLGPRRMRGNPRLLVRNGERRGQDERTHGQEGHRQAGAGDEVTTSNQLCHGRMSTRHAEAPRATTQARAAGAESVPLPQSFHRSSAGGTRWTVIRASANCSKNCWTRSGRRKRCAATAPSCCRRSIGVGGGNAPATPNWMPYSCAGAPLALRQPIVDAVLGRTAPDPGL